MGGSDSEVSKEGSCRDRDMLQGYNLLELSSQQPLGFSQVRGN
jgi:hypothetical protein